MTVKDVAVRPRNVPASLTPAPILEYPHYVQPLPLFAEVRWTVSDLTRHVRQLLETDESLRDVWVQGEVSNLSRPASGHVYFTLKDAGAALRAVIWRSDAARLRVPLQDGLAIEAHGRIGVYEAGGQYQLYVDTLRPAGEGALYAEFLRLKALLEAEGLFDPERKRPLPDLPRRIGVVTSPTGAALRDILSTLGRRLPLAEVVLAPSPVQGAEAPAALAAALADLNRLAAPDVILLARGGGSLEDLWAFNDERVVRAVAASAAPLISGVGHETDFTLCDFAADLRAPTPTAAAELATPLTAADLSLTLRAVDQHLRLLLEDRIASGRADLADLTHRLRFVSPQRRLESERQRLDELSGRAARGLSHRLALADERIAGMRRRLEALDPQRVLARGYAILTRRADGALVDSVRGVAPGEALSVRLADGRLDVRAEQDNQE